MNPHQILAAIELAVYLVLFVPVTFCTYHYLSKRKQTAWIYLSVFVLGLSPFKKKCHRILTTPAKIIGPAMYISMASQSKPSTGLQLGSQILYTIALGPLLNATLSLVNASSKSKAKEPTPAYSYSPVDAPTPIPMANPSSKDSNTKRGSPDLSPLNIILLALHPIIMVGLVLGAVGGSKRSPDSSGHIDPDKYAKAITFSKASAALFMVGLAGIAAGVALLWKSRRSFPTVNYYTTTWMAAVIPCLFLRVLYSVLTAASLDENDPAKVSKFDVLRGSWVIYFFLGFLPQIFIVLVYAACGVLAWLKERRRV